MSSAAALERYLLSLDDDSFFALIRNYIGPIRTPFHKHELITRLVEFLRHKTTRERIAALLDERDLRVLSAISLLGRPTRDRVVQFLGEEIGRAEVTALLLNYRDRLLVIESGEPVCLEINPLLARWLDRELLHPHYVINGVPVSEGERDAPAPWCTLALAAALSAFLREVPDLFTRSGTLRRKTVSVLSERFGALFDGEEGLVRFEEALSALETLDLIERAADGIELRMDAWEAIGELPDHWVQALVWAATLTGSLERAFAFARLIKAVWSVVPLDRAFTPVELVRIMQLIADGEALPIDEETIRRLTMLGLLTRSQSAPNRYRLVADAGALLSDRERSTGVVVHGNMETVVPPGSPFGVSRSIATLTELVNYDLAATFRITRESIGSAVREGVEDPLGELSRLVAGAIPQNVRFLIGRWVERSKVLRLVDGPVLIAGEEAAGVLSAYPGFMELVRENPAPNIFILHRARISHLNDLLDRLGIEGTLSIESDDDGERRPAPPFDLHYRQATQPSLSSRSNGDIAAIFASRRTIETDESVRAANDPRRELYRRLDRLTIGEDERRELALRIDRGLVLFADQLRPEIRSGHATEARGLDYLGKIRLIEQAIGNGDMLEIIMRDGGNPHRMLVRPREIVQSGNDLMLRAIQEPQADAIKIRIRRISLVRRLSGTLIRG